jgi:preprotein translocase subunit SecB
MLRILPKKFRASNIALGPLDELDLQLGERKTALTVEALKADVNKVTILIKLRLVIEDGVGMLVDFAASFDVADEDVPDFEVNDEVLKNTFIQVNAPAIAYPFLRAYVSTISVNSGYDQILLPPVNFQALFDKKRKGGEITTSTTVR